MSAELDRIVDLLVDAEVEFIVVGGLACVLQGAPIVTHDVDIVHRRDPDNVAKLIAALQTAGAHYRHQHGRVIEPRADALSGPGHNLFTTQLGAIDALGALDGHDYGALLPDAVTIDYRGRPLTVLSLERVVALKRAAARPKDLRVLPELEATLRRIRKRQGR